MDGTTECHICGHELVPDDRNIEWTMIGYLNDQMTADFAREVLLSCEIPAFVRSRSGFLGTVGLPLNPFYKSAAQFELSVPENLVAEANEALASALGDQWQKKEA